MTQHTASKVINSSSVLSVVAILAVTFLAYARVIDGATVVPTLLAIMGVATGTNAVTSAKTEVPPRSRPPAQ